MSTLGDVVLLNAGQHPSQAPGQCWRVVGYISSFSKPSHQLEASLKLAVCSQRGKDTGVGVTLSYEWVLGPAHGSLF